MLCDSLFQDQAFIYVYILGVFWKNYCRFQKTCTWGECGGLAFVIGISK